MVGKGKCFVSRRPLVSWCVHSKEVPVSRVAWEMPRYDTVAAHRCDWLVVNHSPHAAVPNHKLHAAEDGPSKQNKQK